MAVFTSDITFTDTSPNKAVSTLGKDLISAADEAAARAAIGSPAFAGDSTATITTNSVIRSQIDSSGNVTSTIPGGSTLLPEFKCRAWVNFDGTTSPGTVRASGNVSSVARNGTGDYTVNFATAMPDVNFSFTGSVAVNSTATPCTVTEYTNGSLRTQSSVRFYCSTHTPVLANVLVASIAVFR